VLDLYLSLNGIYNNPTFFSFARTLFKTQDFSLELCYNISRGEYMKIGILGTGAYGLALALVFQENGNQVAMWTKFPEEKEEIERTRKNQKVLPDVWIPEDIQITNSLEEVCLDKDILVIAIPAAFVCGVSKEIQPFLKNQVLLVASKGIEQKTCLFLNEVLAKHHDVSKLCVMAGGTFAIDIVSKMPVGLSIASKNEKAIDMVRKALENDHFKLRPTSDIYGVEICSSVKNVIAIAAGILDGLGANESTKSMFITESLHDIKELIDHLGGDPKTILSFAGFGDILLTCTSTKSRNFSFGQILVTKTKEEIEEYKKTHTIEGLYTLESIHQLVNDKNVDIGIIDLIYDIVFDQKDPSLLLEFLVNKK